jgi:hypothetical protein
MCPNTSVRECFCPQVRPSARRLSQVRLSQVRLSQVRLSQFRLSPNASEQVFPQVCLSASVSVRKCVCPQVRLSASALRVQLY